MQRTKVCKFGRLKKEEHIKVIFHALLKAIHTQAESKSPDLVDVSHHIFCPGISWHDCMTLEQPFLKSSPEENLRKAGFPSGNAPRLGTQQSASSATMGPQALSHRRPVQPALRGTVSTGSHHRGTPLLGEGVLM